MPLFVKNGSARCVKLGLCGLIEFLILPRISFRTMQLNTQSEMSTKCITRVMTAMTMHTTSLVEYSLDCAAACLPSFVGEESVLSWVVWGGA